FGHEGRTGLDRLVVAFGNHRLGRLDFTDLRVRVCLDRRRVLLYYSPALFALFNHLALRLGFGFRVRRFGGRLFSRGEFFRCGFRRFGLKPSLFAFDAFTFGLFAFGGDARALDDGLRGGDERLGLINAHVEEVCEVVNGRARQRLDVRDAVVGQRGDHRRVHAFEPLKRHGLARRDHRAHLERDLALEFLLAAYVDVPPDELRRQPNVLAALADGERELILVDDDLHLPVLDVGDANLIDLRGRESVGGEDRRLVRPLDDVN